MERLEQLIDISSRIEERLSALMEQHKDFKQEMTKMGEELRGLGNRLSVVEVKENPSFAILESKYNDLHTKVIVLERDGKSIAKWGSSIISNLMQLIQIVIGSYILYKLGIRYLDF